MSRNNEPSLHNFLPCLKGANKQDNFFLFQKPFIWTSTFFLIALVCFFWRWWLIDQFPVTYSWDAFTRIWERDEIFVRHWLPLPQLPLYLTNDCIDSLKSLRLIYSALAALAAVSVGWAVAKFSTFRAGLVGALAIGMSPTLVTYTIVPYQEGMFLLFVGFWAIWWQKSQENPKYHWPALISLGLAQLCRYEAWIIGALLPLWYLLRRQYLKAARNIGYLIVPVSWLLLRPFIVIAHVI